MCISHEAIYQALIIQGRGPLRRDFGEGRAHLGGHVDPHTPRIGDRPHAGRASRNAKGCGQGVKRSGAWRVDDDGGDPVGVAVLVLAGDSKGASRD
jgi:hypothetical protein